MQSVFHFRSLESLPRNTIYDFFCVVLHFYLFLPLCYPFTFLASSTWSCKFPSRYIVHIYHFSVVLSTIAYRDGSSFALKKLTVELPATRFPSGTQATSKQENACFTTKRASFYLRNVIRISQNSQFKEFWIEHRFGSSSVRKKKLQKRILRDQRHLCCCISFLYRDLFARWLPVAAWNFNRRTCRGERWCYGSAKEKDGKGREKKRKIRRERERERERELKRKEGNKRETPWQRLISTGTSALPRHRGRMGTRDVSVIILNPFRHSASPSVGSLSYRAIDRHRVPDTRRVSLPLSRSVFVHRQVDSIQ